MALQHTLMRAVRTARERAMRWRHNADPKHIKCYQDAKNDYRWYLRHLRDGRLWRQSYEQ